MSMAEAEAGDERERRKLPKGFLKPGRLTTTADPEMRKRAERIIREHREEMEEAAERDG